MRIPWSYILLFLGLTLVQVLILNNINIGGSMNPQLYLFFILVLPVNIAAWLLLSLAFVLGLTMDVFSDSLAIHTASTVLMAYARPLALRLVLGNILPDDIISPSFSHFGGGRLFVYCLLLVLIHHLALFFLEVFHFGEVLQTLQRIGLSSTLTLVFVMTSFAFLDRSLNS